MELRQKTLGVELRPVLVAIEIAPETISGTVAVAVAAKRVHLAGSAGIERHPEVRERHRVLLETVAPVVVRLRERVAFLNDAARTRINQVRDAPRIHKE